jgi:hypothetical protein
MAEQTHITTLQRTLAEYRLERRKIQTKLEELDLEVAHYREQLTTFDSMIKQTGDALQNALELGREQIEPSPDSRYGPRPDTRYQQRRDPRYEQRPDPRQEPRYQQRYDPPVYHTPDPSGLHASDIDDVIESLNRDEQSSNIRFADFRIPQAATIVLRESDRPLHVSEIFRRLSEGGFEFRGQHQLITLAVSLSRSKRFRKVAPGTFELDPAYLAGQVA